MANDARLQHRAGRTDGVDWNRINETERELAEVADRVESVRTERKNKWQINGPTTKSMSMW